MCFSIVSHLLKYLDSAAESKKKILIIFLH